MYHLSIETRDDWWEVEALYDTCFAPGRELLSSYRLRDGIDKIHDLSMILRDDKNVISAAIRYWPVSIIEKSKSVEALLLGPIATHPTRQGEGLGGQLIFESLNRAKLLGWERVLLVGDVEYYSRFGFSRLEGVIMASPTNPSRVLGYELVDEAWRDIKGQIVKYQQAHS